MSDSTSETVQQPTVITLNNTNSIEFLSKYIELAQTKGAFILSEAELLKRAVDCILNNVPDKEINQINGRQLLIQGIHKGQRHGAFTLNDAALLSKIVQFVENVIQTSLKPIENTTTETLNKNSLSGDTTQPSTSVDNVVNNVVDNVADEVVDEAVNDTSISDDLSDLAEPVPLKPKEV